MTICLDIQISMQNVEMNMHNKMNTKRIDSNLQRLLLIQAQLLVMAM